MTDDTRPGPERIEEAERKLKLKPGTVVRRHDIDGWSWEKAMRTPLMGYSDAGRKGARVGRWGSTLSLPGSHSNRRVKR